MNKKDFKKKMADFIKKYNLKSMKEVVVKQKELGQKGFTLLELLVVVAILAAIAGTATIALKDTDARASAAAHVAMMDELNKGIRTYRVLRRNELPSNFDSLVSVTNATVDNNLTNGTTDLTGEAWLPTLAIEDVAMWELKNGTSDIMKDGGIGALQYVSTGLDPDGAGSCADIENLVLSRGNAVVAGNIFLDPGSNGCGFSRDIGYGDTVMIWLGGQGRLLGQPNADEGITFNGTMDGGDKTINVGADTTKAFLVTGVGPASTLFDVNELGGMTTVPVYRHVKPHEYNRFMAVWTLGTFNGTNGDMVAADQCELIAIVDGAGDTKEEELGEWDGTRNTI